MQGFYARLRDKRQDDSLLQDCIERVINRLDESETSADRPGMLLGKIQSGKTRGFLGVITRAFDRGYDIALVFTKGTRTLAKQTVRRISSDFKEFVDDELISVYDIMEMPEKLTRSELKRKIVIVAKKEAHNLERVIQLMVETYPELSQKRVLLVDDEADMASVRFVKKQGTKSFKQGSIAQLMDDLRAQIKGLTFLQVTATPYALYLQPENYEEPNNDFVFFPKRPAFTELLPIHAGYVGGDDYFGDYASTDPRFYLFQAVPEAEQDALRSGDGRVIRGDRIWTSSNITMLRKALMTFVLAVVIRRWQQKEQEQRPGKFAMIMHNDTQRAAHQWQWDTVERLNAAFEEGAINNSPELRKLFDEAYQDLACSINAHGGRLPSADLAFEDVKNLIADGELNVQRVNSDVQLAPLLDSETAELRLRTQANVFIGGSILDRGITVPALISFYYGRNPKRMQADTVLQHSRMYGNRDRQDLAVTRFYTSNAVYERLEQIHKLESALRNAFENGSHNLGVVFIENDQANGIVPCSPTKVAMSDVVTLRPNEMYLPTGFDTVDKKAVAQVHTGLSEKIRAYAPEKRVFHSITLAEAVDLLNHVRKALSINKSGAFQWDAMIGLLTYYCSANNEVDILYDVDREINREKSGDKSGRSILGTSLRDTVLSETRERPALVFLEQAGTKDLGWTGNSKFWWPILVSPANVEPCVFANT